MNITDQNQFVPPFCVNPKCVHFHSPKGIKWFRRCGFHTTTAHGIVPRFICKTCNKTCSTQTFDLHYWSQKRVPWSEILHLVKDCSSDRALGRRLNLSPNCIANKTSRLAKWALDSHCKILNEHNLKEDLCADGFETFSQSQYYPAHVDLLVGTGSQFVYGWSHAHLRRKGRMTPHQKERRALLESTWKPPRGAQIKAFNQGVSDHIEQFFEDTTKEKITLVTDELWLYPRILNKRPKLVKLSQEKRFEHVVINSKKPRDGRNPLLPVNYLDRQLRKDLANHVRETTRFAREPNRMMDRMSLYFVYHNLEKDWRIKARKEDRCKHWQMAGIRSDKIPGIMTGNLSRPWLNRDIKSFFRDVWTHSLPVPQDENIRKQACFWFCEAAA